MTARLEPATSEHIPLIVGGMSPLSQNELKRLYPDMSIEDIVGTAISRSDEPTVAYYNDEYVCVMGVNRATLMSNVGRPWLIPHYKNVTKYKFKFLPATKKWIEYMGQKYDRLENIGIQNPRALKWLKWLGFTVGEPFEINGGTFYHYSYVRK